MTINTFPARLLAAALLMSACIGVQAAVPDADGDGVGDNIDNCLNHVNANQRDTDADGIGNVCDADLNDDCIVNAVDLGLFRSRFFTPDPDADFNGDGIVNTIDLGTLKSLFFAPPGPSGSQTLCSCRPPSVVPQADPNFEFNGQEVFLVGSLAGNGVAVAGINNFADQDDGLYLARIFARSAATFDYRIADQSASIDYCSDTLLSAYTPLDVAPAGCATTGSVEITAPGCYEFSIETDGSLLPASVELTMVERLGRWDLQVDPAGGVLSAPNGVVFAIPSGAVASPTTITVGDVPCEQVDALFAATTLNSHSNRCIGGFIGEPTGFLFDLPVAVSVPAAPVTADEIVLWLASVPGRQDYTLVETTLTYRGDLGTVETIASELSIFAAAGAVNGNAPPFRGGSGLPACCDETPTPLGCCCTEFSVTSTAGDATNTTCDCELVGNNIEITFPSCPGSPTFVDQESHSSENCPTDFQATLSTPDLIQWTCEARNIVFSLTGTNDSGAACDMSIPLTWSVDNGSIASVAQNPIGTAAVVTGLAAGTTTFRAVSSVGNQFSIVAPLTVVDLQGQWFATEDGEQTCTVDGNPVVEADSDGGLVGVSVQNCNTITVDVGIAGLDGTTGSLTPTGNLDLPFDFQIQANNATNTLGCYIFNLTDAGDIDFGEPFCPPNATCQATSCTESTMTNGTIASAALGAAVADGSWTFNASWLETVEGDTTAHGATCTGASDLTFTRQ